MHIQLVRADLTSIKVDAIVNPAVAHGDAPRVTSRSALPDDPGALPVGTAVVTTGGNLLCRFIIHAAVPQRSDEDAESKLRQATWSALQRAEELALGSVALPAMATGPSGFTLAECASVMLRTAADFNNHARSLQRVIFCLFGDEAFDTFTSIREDLDV